MRVFHITHRVNAAMILADGVIRPSESNIDPTPPRRETWAETTERWLSQPFVVWTTVDPSWNQPWGASAGKNEVRFVIETSEAVPWRWYAEEHGCDPSFRKALAESGGGDRDWFVIPRAVPLDDRVGVEPRPGVDMLEAIDAVRSRDFVWTYAGP